MQRLRRLTPSQRRDAESVLVAWLASAFRFEACKDDFVSASPIGTAQSWVFCDRNSLVCSKVRDSKFNREPRRQDALCLSRPSLSSSLKHLPASDVLLAAADGSVHFCKMLGFAVSPEESSAAGEGTQSTSQRTCFDGKDTRTLLL